MPKLFFIFGGLCVASIDWTFCGTLSLSLGPALSNTQM